MNYIWSVLECSWNVTLLGERRWEGRSRSHFHKLIISVWQVTPGCEQTLFLQKCFFDVSASNFTWSSVNPLPKPLKCVMRLLENILQPRQWVLNGTHVSRPVECQLKMSNVRGDQAQAKWQKMLKKSRTHPRRPSLNNSWARKHYWDHLWSLPGDLNRKSEHAPHCHKVCSPNLDKWSKSAVRKCASWAMTEG
jgi:hypothetical protein